MATNQEFSASIAAWAQRTEGELLALARQSVQSVAERIKVNTRVDTGNLRANWIASLNTPASETAGAGGRPPLDYTVVIQQMKLGDTFWFSNNTVYALRIEFGFVGPDSLGRVYNQKGDYNVTNTVRLWPLIVQETAQDLGFGDGR